jgi:hypothetical protein
MVATLLAQSMTEREIPKKLKVDQFVYDLAKSDLAYYYKQCLDGIEEVKKKGWDIFNGINNLTTRDKLLALKLIMECNEAKFALFKEGLAIMQVKSMEERLASIESREITQ